MALAFSNVAPAKGILNIPRAGNQAFAPATGIPGGAPAPKPQPGLVQPTLPVKSHTIHNVDGSKVTQVYDTGAKPTAPSKEPNASASGPTYAEGGHAIIPTVPPAGAPNYSDQGNSVIPPAQTPPQPPAQTPTQTQTTTPASPTFTGLIGKQVQSAQGNIPIGQKAADIAADYGQKIADVGGQGARFEAGQKTTGTSPVAEGNAAVTAQTTAAQQQALAQGETAALAGTSQELTAQNQETTGVGNAASNLAPTGSFPFVFDPATGSFKTPGGAATGGGPTLTYNPQTDATSFAQAVVNHQISIDDADKALGYAGNVASGLLDSAIIAAGGNPSILRTQAGIQSDQETQLQTYNSAHQQAANLQSQLSDLITKFNLNPNDLNAANTGIQAIARNTSDARYKILQNYLADVSSRYSQILTPPGGSATDTTRSVASGMLDAVASGQSIIDVMNALDQQAKAVSAGVKTIGTDTNTSKSSGSGPGGSIGWDDVLSH